MYNNRITDEQVQAAARAVRADDFIQKLPGGYGEPVVERGTTLSAGQRQLISFARALAADPAILILDEATASIDSETELAIQEALHVLSRGRTTFIIATGCLPSSTPTRSWCCRGARWSSEGAMRS